MKKQALILSICILVFATGCSSGVPKADKNGNILTYSFTEIPSSGFYVKDGLDFYPLYRYGANFTETPDDNDILGNRYMWEVGDENLIPTITGSAENVLIFTSDSKQGAGEVVLERMEEKGYTLGVTFSEIEGMPSLTFSQSGSFCSGSNAKTILGKLTDLSSYSLDAINGTPMTKELLDPNGMILGLQQDAKYKIECYKGTKYQEIILTADAHLFVSKETVTLDPASVIKTKNGYLIIPLPADLPAGLYNMNGKGCFFYDPGSTDTTGGQ